MIVGARVEAAVAQVSEAAANRPRPMRDSRFWQGFLSLDLPPRKARDVIQRLGPDCVTLEALRESPALSTEERNALPETVEVPADVKAVSLDDENYPECLRLSRDPAPVLMYRGELGDANAQRVAIVGTRKASGYGRAVARKLAMQLAESGVIVVSGGAHGTDTEAHEGALQAGGKTIAVMGSGLKRPFPAANRGLFTRIVENGAVISQFALDTKPDYWRFPLRNLLIAGMCRAVIVVEAPEGSGSLLTAYAAADEGRHVFATPAAIDSESHFGSFRLINDGATLLSHVDQVFAALGIEKRSKPQRTIQLSQVQELILSRLSKEPELADNLSEEMGLAPGIMLSELTNLELEGLVARAGGGYVRL